MRNLLISSIAMLIFGMGYAQKIAYVDTQYILKQMPQFQSSEQRLNNEVKRWQDDIVNQRSKIEKLRISFENEKILLTEDQQKNRLASIDSTEKVLNEYIDKKFGSKGESVTLRYNLAKPLQDQIWNATNSVASRDKYNMVFDKSSDLIMIFTDSKYDITDKVLKQLGINQKNEEKKTTHKNIKNSEPKTSEAASSDRDEEKVDEGDNKPQKGYGSKYKSKKETKKAKATEKNTEKDKTVKETKKNKKNIKEDDKSSSKNETEVQDSETSQPKTGYGSKYVPRKKNTIKKLK